MTDDELEQVARAATPGPWEANPYDARLVESKVDDLGSMKRRRDGAFIAAFNPATALALLERVRKAEAVVTEAKRAGLLLALKQAEEVEREEVAAGHADSASGAEEVKDRIAERIRWMDEGLE